MDLGYIIFTIQALRSPFTLLSHIENDINYLYGDGGNLAAFLYNIKEHKPFTYHRIVHTIQSVAPYFLDFELIPNEGSFVRLLLERQT